MKNSLIYLLIMCLIFGLVACNKTPPKENEELEPPIVIDDTSEYTVSDVYLESSKAVESFYGVEMSVNLLVRFSDGADSAGGTAGVDVVWKETSKIPIKLDESTDVGLFIKNNNDEIYVFCSGFWRLEKLVDGEYKEVEGIKPKNDANNSTGPKGEMYIGCDLKEYNYSELISEGKYRFISPTLHIAKETENGIQDYTYKNEKTFILYSEFEFVK